MAPAEEGRRRDFAEALGGREWEGTWLGTAGNWCASGRGIDAVEAFIDGSSAECEMGGGRFNEEF